MFSAAHFPYRDSQVFDPNSSNVLRTCSFRQLQVGGWPYLDKGAIDLNREGGAIVVALALSRVSASQSFWARESREFCRKRPGRGK